MPHDAPPLRADRETEDAVLLGKGAVVVAAHDLEVVEPGGQPAENEHDGKPDRGESPTMHERAGRASHHPDAPCFSVTRRTSRASG